jgi:hypothetical protein
MVATPLKLRAEDSEDLSILSAALQDAAVPVADMRYFAEERRFILAVSRYRWETDRGSKFGSTGERVASAVVFDKVNKVRRKGFDPNARVRILELLAMEAGEGHIDLLFAGDATIRLEIETIVCRLDDFGAPWATIFRPGHKLD